MNNDDAKPKFYESHYKELPYNPKLKDRAKELRKARNLPEVIFWNQVKREKFLGLDFHRQKIIGDYIVDFYCPELDLVVEIDGEIHKYKQEYDAKRDNYFRKLGLYVIHFKAVDIKYNLDNIMIDLVKFCKSIFEDMKFRID